MRKFSRVYIEITNSCNLSCSFCVQNKRTPRILSVAEFQEIIYKLKGHTKNVYLHVLGEPLMHPFLEEILEICKQQEMAVHITTNGTLLKKQIDLLLNSKAIRKISVSLHSLEQGDNQEYYREVIEFALEASKQNIFCELRLWNMGVISLDNTPALQEIVELLSLDQITLQELLENMNEVGNTTLLPKLFLGKQARFVWPSLELDVIDKPIFCHGLRSQVAILVDGSVVPCCLDSKGDMTLGNIFHQSLEEIVTNQVAQSIYDGFSKREAVMELCKRCQYATRF
ncbi:radical SAM/SPASM domain-containing protein [Tannockella kyphosi]|uniref:radical SAM/SPASM domain-containing protein n=1 Tax=Tannockella kyphosi TaxID=2899121 RepID=UPI002011A75A|nr:radical SAM/SPASM domain-containing protein [Tannockella kyphosi]